MPARVEARAGKAVTTLLTKMALSGYTEVVAAKQQAGVASTVFLPSTFIASLPASRAPQPWQLF